MKGVFGNSIQSAGTSGPCQLHLTHPHTHTHTYTYIHYRPSEFESWAAGLKNTGFSRALGFTVACHFGQPAAPRRCLSPCHGFLMGNFPPLYLVSRLASLRASRKTCGWLCLLEPWRGFLWSIQRPGQARAMNRVGAFSGAHHTFTFHITAVDRFGHRPPSEPALPDCRVRQTN